MYLLMYIYSFFPHCSVNLRCLNFTINVDFFFLINFFFTRSYFLFSLLLLQLFFLVYRSIFHQLATNEFAVVLT